MPTLTHAYIAQHRNTTHTYAAFGKLMMGAILDSAAAALGTSSMNSLNVQVNCEVSPFEGKDCIRIVSAPQTEKHGAQISLLMKFIY